MDRRLISTSALLAAVLLSACASEPVGPPPRGDVNAYLRPEVTNRLDREGVAFDAESIERMMEADAAASAEMGRVRKEDIQDSYAQGVRDTVEEFRGRMHGRAAFVYEPPMIEYVEMPAQVVNGAMIPTHKEAVIVAAGRWVEANNIAIPKEQAKNTTAPRKSRIQYVEARRKR